MDDQKNKEELNELDLLIKNHVDEIKRIEDECLEMWGKIFKLIKDGKEKNKLN